ncbi:MAG: hypothetical protein C5B59_10745 [Bacteroidetes bacterium]|nr:MAG: hypothetical protein C5B59_10745 [Bacteroidota bacterium]
MKTPKEKKRIHSNPLFFFALWRYLFGHAYNERFYSRAFSKSITSRAFNFNSVIPSPFVIGFPVNITFNDPVFKRRSNAQTIFFCNNLYITERIRSHYPRHQVDQHKYTQDIFFRISCSKISFISILVIDTTGGRHVSNWVCNKNERNLFVY